MDTLNEKVDEAINFLRENEERTNGEGYKVGFSGGKDSVVTYDLVKRAGVKVVSASFAVSGIDPPEVISFIRKNYPEVIFHRPKWTMGELIARYTSPPTSLTRYCCRMLHEVFSGHVIVGTRREESPARRKRERIYKTKHPANTSIYCPIINFTEKDVWDYIKENNLPYCKLYDEGFSRIGCIGCPLKVPRLREFDFSFWPSAKKYYLVAFERMLKNGKRNYTWKSAEEVFNWWLRKKF